MQAQEIAQADAPDRELTPAEVKDALSALKKEYCLDLREELGIEVVFPKGSIMGDADVSGKTLEQVLNMLMGPLETYEPPIIRQESGKTETQRASQVPLWLKGREGLIWRGAMDNPLWGIEAKQYGNDVTIGYTRRNRLLKPGKTAVEQGRTLAPIHNTFTVQEWKMIQILLDEYKTLEKNRLAGGDAQTAARKQMATILKEENAFRRGQGDTPATLRERVEAAVEKVARTTRGFKRESIDIDGLTQRAAEILSQLVVLNRTRGDGRERVPTVKKDIKEIPSFRHSLSLLARCLDTQRVTKKGLTLMLGEPGTGKNEAAEYVAARTNRPFFWFPCGRGMEAAEMVTHYEFDSKEGTQRFLTALAEGIQTPGAIVMVDEVNALKPEVQAILHGLGDSNRALNFDGIYIPVAEDVLIVIAGNPATQGSAGNLGEALLSRTRGQSMVMDYASLRKGELLAREEGWGRATLEHKETEDNRLRDYACDEVLILYPLFNEFSGLDDDEFAILWDCIVNEQTQGARRTELEANPKLKALVEGSNIEHIRKTLVDLRDILEIADEWRKKYEKREGGFDLLGMSMRDTLAIAQRYKDCRDVHRAYLSVFDDFRKNPIDGLDSMYVTIEQLLNDKLAANPLSA